MLPTIIFLYKYPLPTAVGTTITAVVVTAASGALGHLRQRNVDLATVRVVAPFGTLGAAVGSVLFTWLSKEMRLFSLALGLAFLYASLRMVYEGLFLRRVPERAGSAVPGSVAQKAALGLTVGLIAGLLGLGGGYMLTPSFIYLLGSPVKIAVGTSMASFIGIAAVSSVFKLYQGVVDALAAACMGAGAAVGAQLGATLVGRSPPWLIKAVFGALFLYVSIRLVLQAL